MSRSHLLPVGGAERHDEVDPSCRDVRSAEPPERGNGVERRDAGPQVELQEVVRVGPLREDPELRQGPSHGDRD